MVMKLFDEPKLIGSQILVKIIENEEDSLKSSLIEIPKHIQDRENYRADMKTDIGLVIRTGPTAYLSIPKEDLEVFPGRYVLFIQNSGKLWNKPNEPEVRYKVIGERDVMLVVGEESND